MKTSKRFLALMLSALMIFSVVFIPGADLSSLFSIEAEAAITLGGITQERVISNYASLYESYRNKYLLGRETNWPTNFVIPGLSSDDDYTPQGMTYWKEKEWILISAYDANTTEGHVKQNSVVYALDAVTTEFVALFKIFNTDKSVNTSHGGGIAASEYNFYYADSASLISYVPLSEMDVEPGTVKDIYLWDSIDCSGELYGGSEKSAPTSFCCYDEGVLWAGNFYYEKNTDYSNKANSKYNSLLIGFKLHGESSEEEWYNLQDKNIIDPKGAVNSPLSQTQNYDNNGVVGNATLNYTVNVDDNGYYDISAQAIMNSGDKVPEICPTFGSVYLFKGLDYSLEFDYTDKSMNGIDFYLLYNGGTTSYTNTRPTIGGKDMTVTQNADGTWHYKLNFTPGVQLTKPDGTGLGECNWATSANVTGSYNIRFDIDDITANRDVKISNLHIYERHNSYTVDENDAHNCVGNPSYVIAFNNNIDKIQYAMVDKGRIYISRSWDRNAGDNHTRALAIADIDISAPGTESLTINNRSRKCHLVNTVNQFGVDTSKNFSEYDMPYMGEALCVMDDYLYIFGEGAAYNYRAKSSDVCTEPIDVIWKIDQYAILGEERPVEEVSSIYYEKVTSLNQIKDQDNGQKSEYLIVFESKEKDPVTQKNYIYALDSFGGYGYYNLPKQNTLTPIATGDSIGVIGHRIDNYSTDYDESYNEIIYITEEDDNLKSIRWNINVSGNTCYIQNCDYYYNKNSYLSFNTRVFSMSDSAYPLGILESGNGDFYIYYSFKDANNNDAASYLWCNDGTLPSHSEAYSSYYSNHGITDYLPRYDNLSELDGTFHADGMKYATNSGNVATAVPDVSYGEISIYKKVPDPYSTTYDTRVHTDMNAELQSDGTYTVTLETYANSPIQYQTVNSRPTDFILLFDNSTSMGTENYRFFNGFRQFSSFDLQAAAGTTEVTEDWRGDHTFTGNMWIQHEDGVMCNVSVRAVGNGTSSVGWYNHQKIYLWYTHPKTNVKYWYHPSTKTWTINETTNSEAQDVKGHTQKDRYNTIVYSGVCYQRNSETSPRLSNVQIAANQLVWKIQENAANYNLDHRIAVAAFSSPDSNSGLYTASDNAKKTYGSITTDNYKNAFYSVSKFNDVKNVINGLTATGGATQHVVGLNMASNIIQHSDSSYFADGNRSVCVVMFTDGTSFTNTIANAAINVAKSIKQTHGGYIYTVRFCETDSDTSEVDVSEALELISSDYLFASSLSSPGEKNIKNIDFSLAVQQFNSTTEVDNTVQFFYNSITSNSVNALAKLDASSIVREHINSLFLIPQDHTVKLMTAKQRTDGLGRISFENPVPVTDGSLSYSWVSVANSSNKAFDVTGFDYTANYVSADAANQANGKKLVIEISGLLANPDYEFNNANITVHDNTALYQNSTYLSANNPIKYYPAENFTIPEYTYILDYGIEMLDTDVNGELIAISQLPTKQSGKVGHLNANNVTMRADNWLDLIYGLKNSNSLTYDEYGYDHSSGYCLIKRDSGKYDWFKINILPASNVYLEENKISIPSNNGTYTKWTSVGTPKTFYQSLTSDSDIYGFEEAYKADGTGFSYGTAYTSTVAYRSDYLDEAVDNSNRSDTLSFTYTGNAIDLYGSCGKNTGIYIVTIKNGNSVEKAYILDTYFSDSNYYTDGEKINQVPILHHNNADIGTYTVEITSAYLSSVVGKRGAASPVSTFALDSDITFYTRDITEQAKEAILVIAEMEDLLEEDIEVIFCDNNSVLNGGTGAGEDSETDSFISTFGSTGIDTDRDFTVLTNYFDGYRVYNPLYPSFASDNYVTSELGMSYFSVIDKILESGQITSNTGELNGIAYVESVKDQSAENQPESTIEFSNYEKTGPSNEIYLIPGNNDGIAFNVQLANASSRVMVSLRAVNGTTQATINGNKIDLTTSNEMYYDITNYLEIDQTTGIGTVTIKNSGSNLLSIDNIKLNSEAAIAPMMMASLPRIRMMMTASEPVISDNTSENTENQFPENPPYIEPNTDIEDTTGNEQETPDDNTDSDSILNIFEDILAEIKSFFDMIIRFFKTLFA
ncbi:MAG: hypothetical protein E7535_03030 [Ruminococcaceae bacterium]|nr:hypothetical protein [Oscillospiraceae bacterium]